MANGKGRFPRKVINMKKGTAMNKQPKPYKLKKRNDKGGVYYIIDKATGKSRSSKTTDKHQARELAQEQYNLTDNTNAAFHMKCAEMHLAKCNPEWTINTWDMIAKRMINGPRGRFGGEKKPRTIATAQSCWNNACWNRLRDKRVIDTVPNDFHQATKGVGIALVNFGKQLHNYATNHRLMPYPIMGTEMWVKHQSKPRSRAVSEEEHHKILHYINSTKTDLWGQYIKHHPRTSPKQWRDEWVNYLWFLWFTAASSSDAANMKAENIKWNENVLEYTRDKWVKPDEHAPVRVAIAKGGQLEELLKRLPKSGNLFSLLSRTRVDSRSNRFRRIIDALGISGISIHGYRYAFAERAKRAGMSAEDRMANLGHSTFEMTNHYDKKAKVVPASIEVLDGGLKVA
mgnify:CR=1 FL=1